MKLANYQAQNLYAALKTIDESDDTVLGETRLPLAINLIALEPHIRAYEKAQVKVREEGSKALKAKTGTPSDIEVAMSLLADAEIEVELKTIDLSDLKMNENKAIKIASLSALAPIIKDLGAKVPASPAPKAN